MPRIKKPKPKYMVQKKPDDEKFSGKKEAKKRRRIRANKPVKLRNDGITLKAPKLNEGRTPEEKRQINQHVERIRGLMCMAMSSMDIKRLMMEQYGISMASYHRYLKLAKKRQMRILEKTAPEAKADSLNFWSRRLMEAMTGHQKAQQDAEEARTIVKSVRGFLKALNESEVDTPEAYEAFEQISKALANATQLYESAKHLSKTSRHESFELQDRLDRLFGNYVTKVNLVDSEGKDVKPIEPLSRSQVREEFLAMMREGIASLSPHERETLGLPLVLPSGSEALPETESVIIETEAIPMEVVEEN